MDTAEELKKKKCLRHLSGWLVTLRRCRCQLSSESASCLLPRLLSTHLHDLLIWVLLPEIILLMVVVPHFEFGDDVLTDEM